jgi:DNA/RNA-binding domain of Phe-tRNA-synthetase-like protein
MIIQWCFMLLEVEKTLENKFSNLSALVMRLEGAKVRLENPELEKFKGEVIERIKSRWVLEQLREYPVFRAYRDFFWRIGVDPTKTRPASEALIRRVLRERSLPRINTFVDAYNLASMEAIVPLAAFDMAWLSGDLLMREAILGEKFLGIGMKKPVILEGGEVVVEDGEKLIAIYPYRDAEAAKITVNTEDVLMLVCGVPNVSSDILNQAERISIEYVTRFCGGSLV